MDRDLTPDIPHSRALPPERTPERQELRSPADRDRHPERRHGLTDSESATLLDIGRFRTVAPQDLTNHLYRGKGAQMQADLRHLAALGLIQRRTALVAKGRATLAVVVLTKAGKALVEGRSSLGDQAVYSGFVKPAEVAHDAAIYRMFHKEAGKIVNEGGVVRRVVLDYELKRNVYAPLAKARELPALQFAKKQAEVAKENGLKVVAGKIPLPDLRIEYDTSQGERTFVDLELATHHYHGSHLQTKIDAGFKLYAEGGGARVRDEREITAQILSL